MRKRNKLVELINLVKNDVVVLGCSTGPDSMALLDVLVKKSRVIGFKIVVAHINHNVRKASYKEEKFLLEYCQKNNLFFEKMVITDYGDDNFHNEARNIRYRYFDELARKYNANYVMTAHHGDDLVETVLMRLVRGSTLFGYAGFREEIEKDTYKIVRPFIRVSKEEILDYNKQYKVPYFIDKSNDKDKYTRNRYRKYVLSFLKKENSGVHLKFLQYSEKLNKALVFLDEQVSCEYKKCYKNQVIDVEYFLSLNTVIQSELINKILQDVYQDDLILINERHVDLILSLINSKKKNNFICLPNDFIVKKEYNKVAFCLKHEELLSYEVELSSIVDLPNGKTLEIVKESNETNNNVIKLNSLEIVLPLIVRTRRIGDKMQVKNMNGHKKIKDMFIDLKIPVEKRDTWPIVTDSMGTIVFVPGIKKSKYDKTKKDGYDIIIKYY